MLSFSFSVFHCWWCRKCINFLAAKINEETGEDQDDNITFDDCDVDDDDIDEVWQFIILFPLLRNVTGVSEIGLAGTDNLLPC
jgi:hypothetical protein